MNKSVYIYRVGKLRLNRAGAACLAIAFIISLSGCEGTVASRTLRKGKYETAVQKTVLGQKQKKDSIFGDGGLFGQGAKTGPGQGTGGGVAVNSFLWRSSLDTMAFMPLSSADPFGGVIITDWYSFPEKPNERFKVNIFILSPSLRADGIKASVFWEQKDGAGNWVTGTVDTKMATGIEDSILTKARKLRMSVSNQ